MVTWWHHKAKVEHVGGVKIQEANEYTKKGNSQSEAQTGKKKYIKRKRCFPSSLAVAAGYQDCPVIGRFQRQQSKTRQK